MRKSGQSLIEFTFGFAIFVAVVLVLVDFSFILWGVESNDMICQSAARAAASGEPFQATDVAQTVVDRKNESNSSKITSNYVLVQPVDVCIESEPGLQTDPISGQQFNPGGPIEGTVTVATEVNVRPFFMKWLGGKKRKLTFRSQHTYPITYMVPSTRSSS